MNIVILMAGQSEDFKEKGYHYPKYLLELENEPLILKIVKSLNRLEGKRTFILRKEDQEAFYLGDTLKILCPDAEIIQVERTTKGAACTVLLAIESIQNDQELLVVNGDQLIVADLAEAVEHFRSRKLDGGIITFPSVHPHWSYVLLDKNGYVVQTSEKRPISNMATAGCYYYRHGSDCVAACMSVVERDASINGFYYISSTYNELILRQKCIGVYGIDRCSYISFATVQMYESYMVQQGVRS